jgi:hypothetical protein
MRGDLASNFSVNLLRKRRYITSHATSHATAEIGFASAMEFGYA